LLSLISLQDLKEVFVRLRTVLEAVLQSEVSGACSGSRIDRQKIILLAGGSPCVEGLVDRPFTLTYLDLVDIRDRVVELNRASLFHGGLLSRVAIHSCLGVWSGCMSISSNVRMSWGRSAICTLRTSPLLMCRTSAPVRVALARPLAEQTASVLSRCTELCFRTLHAMLNRWLPISRPLVHVTLRTRRRSRRQLRLHSTSRANRMYGRARRCSYANTIGIVFQTTLDPIARRQEGVESLDQIRVTRKKI